MTGIELVTAVIPACNAERFLAEAIESVLAQSYRPLECLVVDDGSTDATAEVAARFGDRVRIIAQPNAGVARARNRGAAEARGELVAFLDADDRWLPRRLAAGVAALVGNDAESVLCSARVIGDRAPMGKLIRLDPPDPTVESLLLWRGRVVSPGSALLARRNSLMRIGGFDDRLTTTADWELLVRLVGRGRMFYLDEALVEYRWHDCNSTHDVANTERDLRRAYEIVLKREGPSLEISSRRAYGGMHKMLAAANFRLGHPRAGAGHAARALLRDPAALGHFAARRLRSAS